MNHPFTTLKALICLATVALFATTPPVFADAMPAESVNDSAVFNTGKMPANTDAEARPDDICAAADEKESCKTASGFPPMDVVASLFSAMTGCSRNGM
jgi:hypothetical protein